MSENAVLCGNGLSLSQTRPCASVCSTRFMKTLWEKEKLLETSNFSFSHSVFYLFGELSDVFVLLKSCRLKTLISLEESKISRFGKDKRPSGQQMKTNLLLKYREISTIQFTSRKIIWMDLSNSRAFTDDN